MINFEDTTKPPKVDQWEPNAEDLIFKAMKGFIIAPIAKVFGLQEKDPGLDLFNTSPKKCYNSDDMHNHVCLYLNYFERFYDPDKELFSIMANMRWLMSYQVEYRRENFLYDLRRYILSPSIVNKVMTLTGDNYRLDLNYSNISNPPLQYTNDDAKYLMAMSVLMCFTIPLASHFAYSRRIPNIDEFLLECYEGILYLFEDKVDMYSKLRETSSTNVTKNEKQNPGIWEMQDIRGKDTVIHAADSIDNIILNLMPKYDYTQNMVSLNWVSIQKNTKFKVTDIGFEYTYVPLSSARRDEDSTSDYDKFEANTIKQSEGLYLQNKVNCSTTMDTMDQLFGPFDEKEISFYQKELANEKGNCLHPFQAQLVYNLCYKYFGDTIPVYGNNVIGSLKLMIIARTMLQRQQMIVLPYILSGRTEKLVGRKTVNKKELIRIESSPYYLQVVEKYQNDKIMKQIFSTIATLISSDFRVVDFKDQSIHGMKLEVAPEIISDEYLLYTLLV